MLPYSYRKLLVMLQLTSHFGYKNESVEPWQLPRQLPAMASDMPELRDTPGSGH